MNIFEAVRTGKLDQVKELIAVNKSLVNAIEACNGYATTPLHEAARLGLKDIVQYLLEEGADVEATGAKSECKPILTAIDNDHYDLVKIIVPYMENINEVISNPIFEERLVHTLARHHLIELIIDLKEHSGLDINALDESGANALHYAAANALGATEEETNSNLGCIKKLWQLGCDETVKSNNGLYDWVHNLPEEDEIFNHVYYGLGGDISLLPNWDSSVGVVVDSKDYTNS